MASALAFKATQAGIKTRFITAADLMLQLALARAQGRLTEYLNRAVLGPRAAGHRRLGYLPFGREEANLFFHVIAKRYERASTIADQQPALRSGPRPSPTMQLSRRRCWIGCCTTSHRADQWRELSAKGRKKAGRRQPSERPDDMTDAALASAAGSALRTPARAARRARWVRFTSAIRAKVGQL